MLINVDSQTYHKLFPNDPHSFISESFIDLNKHKVEKIIRLVDDDNERGLGLIAGYKDGVLLSPFSAPFGGFHFRNEIIYVDEIDSFLSALKDYIDNKKYSGIEFISPPDLYHVTFNAKVINAFIRLGFKLEIPDITGWIDLRNFKGSFTYKNSREHLRQAFRNELRFSVVTDNVEKISVYNLICENRARFGRPIYMTYDNLLDIRKLWPVDFLKVCNKDKTIVASAILYRNHPEIVYAVFWGDNEIGRSLRAMDFLAFNLWTYYKEQGFKFIDVGTSTEKGLPNIGLIRFKESHEASSSLRYRFSYYSKADS